MSTTTVGAFAYTALALLLLIALPQGAEAETARFGPGSRVEGHIGSHWAPCEVVGNQLRTGGYLLHCDALPGPDNVFSETDVREIGAAQPAPVGPAPAAAPQGRPVQGHVFGNWENCTMIGGRLPTGGYRLHCDSLPDPDNVFSDSDVREIGAAQPAPVGQAPAAAPQGRPVQGRVFGNWENCTMIGGRLPTGGYRLHCDSLPHPDNVFSDSDVRMK
jgi:hypothetical protein